MEYTQTDAKKAKSKMLLDRHGRMESDRSGWENNWQETLDHTVPRKSDIISTRTPGQKRGNELFDTTAIQSNQLLSAALHSMLTNPVLRFFDMRMQDLALNQIDEVKSWLQDTAERMFQLLNSSNFQTEVHEIYLDLGSIGTACLFMGEDKDKLIHFSARPMKEIYVAENNLGMIDTVHRVFEWNLRQIVQEFGEDVLPPDLLKKYKEGLADPFKILHCVSPMTDEEYSSKGKIHKFGSCYLLKDSGFILSEGGYYEFPFAVPRWTKTSGEVYGRGPGMDMLPDIKMVNAMMLTTLKGAQKTVDPPLMVADDGVIGNVRLTPGGLTVVRPVSDVPIRPLITDARIDFGIQLVESIRRNIRAGFMIDQLQLRDGPQMTAQEVRQRAEENSRLMGPVLGRQNFEFLGPVTTRVYGEMLRKGRLSKPPQAIQDKPFEVYYSSLLARAQKMGEGEALTRAFAVATPFLQANPASLDVLECDEAVRFAFENYGAPQRVIRKADDIAKTRKARAQAQEKVAREAEQTHDADVANKTLPAVAQLQAVEQNARAK